jgi:uncharacterized C2H2 Zn-finger protein
MSPLVRCPRCERVFRTEGTDYVVPAQPVLDRCFFCNRDEDLGRTFGGRKGVICAECVAKCVRWMAAQLNDNLHKEMVGAFRTRATYYECPFCAHTFKPSSRDFVQVLDSERDICFLCAQPIYQVSFHGQKGSICLDCVVRSVEKLAKDAGTE